MMRFVKTLNGYRDDSDLVPHCAALATSIVLRQPYRKTARILKPQNDTDYPVARLDKFLRKFDFIYVSEPNPFPLGKKFRIRGTALLFLEIFREGEWQGHYAAFRDTTLYDWEDSRDGVLNGCWLSVGRY